jgi:predicted SnoaL-like aldol condensation-catalyzing enzyme
MEPKTEVRKCNVLTEEDIDESSRIPNKNHNYYILHNNSVCKSKNGKVYYIVKLDGFSEDQQQAIVDKINDNIDTLVVKTTYVNGDPKSELVIFDIKGQNKFSTLDKENIIDGIRNHPQIIRMKFSDVGRAFTPYYDPY